MWLVLVLLLPLSMGGALVVPALTALLLDAVPEELAGTASGLLNSLRQTGGALAVALFGGLLTVPGGDSPGMRIGLLTITALSHVVLPRR